MKNKKKILFISTYEKTGGAAIACKRIFNALRDSGDFEVRMLVLFKETDDEDVHELFPNSFLRKYRQRLFLALEQLYIRPKLKSKKLYFQFSSGYFGYDISKNTLLEWADFINVHWIHQGFLSIKGISNICNKDKNIYWTMHDMWAFSGGEHYVGDNISYLKTSGNSEFLKNSGAHDFSNKIWKKKERFLKGKQHLKFLSPSTWMQNCCKESSLFKNHECLLMPNLYEPIKIDFQEHTSGKINLLFGAGSIFDERKGFYYLAEAINQLPLEEKNKITLLLFGKGNAEEITGLNDVEVKHMGFLDQPELIKLYSESDILVMPTLEDNLPNTVVESMAYYNAIVGFDTGGMTDLVQHNKNGYLSKVKDSKALGDNLIKLINSPETLKKFQLKSHELLTEKFSAKNVISLYKNLN